MTEPWKRSVVARNFARIVDHPWICVCFLVVISCIAAAGYIRPGWPTHVSNWIWPKPAIAQTEPQKKRDVPFLASNGVKRDSLGRAEALLVLQSDQFFTREGSIAIREVVQALEDLDFVSGVRWLDQAPPLNIFGLPEPILPKGQASEQRFENAKQKAVRHPLVVGQLLSPDAKTMLLGISFHWVMVTEEADCTTKLVEVAQQAIAKHPDVTMSVGLTGEVPLRLRITSIHKSNSVKYQFIGYGMILLMAIILFRGFTVVIVVALAPATGVFWAIGFLRYLGWEDNPFSEVILPVLLSLVGFADGVHMMVYIRSCLSQGQTPREACRNALATVGVACSITTITTAIGMGSLSFSNHEIVREFAWSCVMGTTTILVSVLLVIPLACCTPWGKRLERGAERGLIDRYIQQIGVPVASMMRHSKLVAYFAVALMIVLAATALMLRPDDRLSNELPSGSPEQQMMSHLDTALGGLQQCTINVAWKGKELEPIAVASIVHKIDTVLDSERLVGHPLSIVRILKALPGDEGPVDKMPMVEILPPPLKLALYDPDQHLAKITFRVQDLGTATYKPVFQRIESSLKELKGVNPGVEITLEGNPIRRWKNLYQIVSDLAMSLGTASIEILIVMGIAFRSLRLGLIAIIPNMIPLAAAGTFMVLANWPLDVVSVCAFTICLGIAVDDTIHFLSRYREELHQQPNRTLALQQAFLGVGTGMIMTTLVLVAGFGSVLISETRDHRVFASLGIITLLSALLCDLFLLPSLLAHFDKARSTDTEGSH